MRKIREPNSSSPWALIILFGIIALLLVIGAYWFYREQGQSVRDARYSELKAIAELKASQIVAWRQERLADARMYSTGIIRHYVLQWLNSPDDAALEADIRARLQVYRELQDYQNLILTAPDGRLLVSLATDPISLDPDAERLVAQAVSSLGVVFGDFFRCPVCKQVHLDVAAPILDDDHHPVAVLIIRVDPERYLYPVIQSWPLPSASAETLLTRREGDEALFLNRLRHRLDPPLTLRIPFSRSDVPAVQAGYGKTGVFEGTDYRGVRVLADIRAVPESPWFMVAKVDADEILAEARYRAGVFGFGSLALVLLAGLGVGFVYKHKGKRTFQALYRAERERREAHEEIRATLYGIGDGVIATDGSGRVTRMNPVAETLTGWSEAEAVGKPLEQVFRIVNEATRTEIENPLARVLREGKVVGLANHTLLISRDGVERPIADSGAPILNEEGQITGMALVFRDQAEERAAAESIRAIGRRFHTILSHLFIGVVVASEENRIEFVNQIFCDQFNLPETPSALIGLSSEDMLQKAMEAYANPAETMAHIRNVIAQDKPVFGDEVPMRDGRVLLVDFVPITVDGKKGGRLWQHRDITERKRSEESLEKSEERFSKAFQSSPDAVVISRLIDGRLVEVNQGFSLLTGYSREEALASSAAALSLWVEPQDRERCVAALREKEGVRDLEFKFRTKSGEILECLYSGAIIDLGGEPHILSVVRDITKRKQAEEERLQLERQLQQMQKAESLGRMAGAIAHHFNNQLGAVIGNLELALLHLPQGSTSRANLAAAMSASGRAAEISRLMLTYLGQSIGTREPIALADLCRETLPLLGTLLPKSVRLMTDLPQPGPVILADAAQVRQVLTNLVVNAGEAMGDREGDVTVAVRVTAAADIGPPPFYPSEWEPSQDSYVCLSVSDNGSGIDPESLKRLFDPFYSTKFTGRGLGLSVVLGVVKAHDGAITVENNPGLGTVFRVLLPLSKEHSRPSLEAESAAPAPPEDHGLVLLVEDEPMVRDMAETMLNFLGYTVVTAGDGVEALQLFHEHGERIECVILDLTMPRMGGWETLAALRALREDLPVILASGYDEAHVMAGDHPERPQAFLSKPYRMTDLQEALKAVWQRTAKAS